MVLTTHNSELFVLQVRDSEMATDFENICYIEFVLERVKKIWTDLLQIHQNTFKLLLVQLRL